MTHRKRSSRRQKALEAQLARERRQRLQYGGIALIVIVVLGGLYWWTHRPKTVEEQVPSGAGRTFWGPADAPVVIEEWSDFN